MSLAWVLGAEPPMNACRYAPGERGHVESYFVRAVHPERPLAVWIKATILAPLDGEPVAETWLIAFDGERKRTWANKASAPLQDAAFLASGETTQISAGTFRLSLADPGLASGSLSSPDGNASFDLSWSRLPALPGEPLSLYPSRILLSGPFPRSKLLTPFPWLQFHGSLEVFGEKVPVEGWEGAQGHNWGKEHPFEYAWGQCNFPGKNGEPDTSAEGYSGRIKLGGRPSPRFSALVVRRGDREYRFDTTFDVWRQEAHLDRERWSVRFRGRDGEARWRMDGVGRPFVCLGYVNPDGHVSYCFNTKLADVLLEVQPRGEAPFTCRSAHGGALEFLRPRAGGGLRVV
jgi:hypothetical protein